MCQTWVQGCLEAVLSSRAIQPRLRSAILREAHVPWYKKFNWYSFALYRYKACWPAEHWLRLSSDCPSIKIELCRSTMSFGAFRLPLPSALTSMRATIVLLAPY